MVYSLTEKNTQKINLYPAMHRPKRIKPMVLTELQINWANKYS